MKKSTLQLGALVSLVISLSIAILFASCSSPTRAAHLETASKFVECITHGKTAEVSRYSTEPTAKLVDKLLADTLCFDDTGQITNCPGFRDVVNNVTKQPRNKDGAYDWPKVVRDSLSSDKLKAWVWLEYPKESGMVQYALVMINVDETWLVDLPMIE